MPQSTSIAGAGHLHSHLQQSPCSAQPHSQHSLSKEFSTGSVCLGRLLSLCFKVSAPDQNRAPETACFSIKRLGRLFPAYRSPPSFATDGCPSRSTSRVRHWYCRSRPAWHGATRLRVLPHTASRRLAGLSRDARTCMPVALGLRLLPTCSAEDSAWGAARIIETPG
jgi:hypothetical protein